MKKKRILERKHRLQRGFYRGRRVITFALCFAKTTGLVRIEDAYSPIEEILFESLERWDCDSHVHLFMPDHCHLMLEGRSESSDLWRCVVDFKQKSGYWLSQKRYPSRWQKDFYDHVLRAGEDIRKQMKYILENPVRKGIADDWREYRPKGSTIHDLDEWDY